MDLIKKTLLTGLGATVTTKEKVESMLHEFVEKGKITSQEAQQMAERIVEDGKREYEEAKGEVQGQFDNLLKRANVVTTQQFSELEERVKKLEEQMESHKHEVTGSDTTSTPTE